MRSTNLTNGRKGQVTFRAIGVLALVSASIVCFCLAQTDQPPTQPDAPDQPQVPAAPDQPDQPDQPQPDQSAATPAARDWPATTPSYQVIDLGTLGGAGSFAAGKGGGQSGRNAAGMVVGTSNAADNSEHAFLFMGDQMYDLNDLCDLSTSDFAVLTGATSIDDAGQIIGQGITTNQQQHAFLLKPSPVDGGNWSYNCCQWIWKQQQPVTVGSATTTVGIVEVTAGGAFAETGWWWESDCQCYKWHGPPTGTRPPCPTQPPHCSYWPLPCPPNTNCHPYPQPAWCCLNGKTFLVNDFKECTTKGGHCFPSKKAAENYCQKKTCWCCFYEDFTGKANVFQMSEADCKKHHGQCFDSQSAANQKCNLQVTPTPTPTGTPSPTPTGTPSPTPSGTPTGTPTPTPIPITPPGKCWCCLPDSLTPVLADTNKCTANGGKCFGTYAGAQQNCGLSWCCKDGQVSQSATNQCLSSGGQSFSSEAAAKANCTPTPDVGIVSKGPKCWCSHNGKVSFIPTVQCHILGGKCFDSEYDASKHTVGFCCVDGHSEGDDIVRCSERNGTYYSDWNELLKHCGDTCWCCYSVGSKRQITHEPTKNCTDGATGNCHPTLDDALMKCPGAQIYTPTTAVLSSQMTLGNPPVPQPPKQGGSNVPPAVPLAPNIPSYPLPSGNQPQPPVTPYIPRISKPSQTGTGNNNVPNNPPPPKNPPAGSSGSTSTGPGSVSTSNKVKVMQGQGSTIRNQQPSSTGPGSVATSNKVKVMQGQGSTIRNQQPSSTGPGSVSTSTKKKIVQGQASKVTEHPPTVKSPPYPKPPSTNVSTPQIKHRFRGTPTPPVIR